MERLKRMERMKRVERMEEVLKGDREPGKSCDAPKVLLDLLAHLFKAVSEQHPYHQHQQHATVSA